VRGTGVDHFDLVVSSLDRSLALYRELLRPLGYTRVAEIVGERGERVVYLSGAGIVPFSLREAQSEFDGLIWPHCDGLIWPHLRPTASRRSGLFGVRPGGGREDGIEGGAVRADQA
jgi:catechol 2,3-dioxygenase-like lactoylglutathione lyase family enzyme